MRLSGHGGLDAVMVARGTFGALGGAVGVSVCGLLTTDGRNRNVLVYYNTWEGLERAGALDALGSLFIKSNVPVPFMSIVRAWSPFPPTNAKNEYTVPRIGKNTILLNGKGAPHADSISAYQFRRFQRRNELGKMGVMNEDWYQENKKPYLASRLMTTKLIQLWEDGNGSPSNADDSTGETGEKVDSAPKTRLENGSKRHMYPFGQLQLRKEVRGVEFDKHPMSDEIKSLSEVIPNGKKITVVFATNRPGFILKHTTGVKIERQQVDDEGKLKSEEDLVAFCGKHLDRSLIDVRFQMCAS